MRILFTGVLGGIVMFAWASIAHMALPLGEAGITEIPNESAFLNSLPIGGDRHEARVPSMPAGHSQVRRLPLRFHRCS